MSTANPFDLLGGDDNHDPTILAATLKPSPDPAAAANLGAVKPAKLPTKPLPPAQAVREARNDGGRGGVRGFGRGGRGGAGGYNRDSNNSETTFGNDNGAPYKPSEERDAGRFSERRPYAGPRGGSRGGRRSDFSNGEAGDVERPRRTYDRHSGTGRGTENKREGSGRGNWGSPTDEISLETEEPAAENGTNVAAEKQLNEEDKVDANKENPAKEDEEKDPEELQMTLEEYEKVLEEKRKAFVTLKVDERKVDIKEFESMQVVSKKKDNNEVFAKLGSEKEKRKDTTDKEEKTKKSVSINEFLKPAEGESYNRSGGRGRGRGRGPRGGGYSGGGRTYNAPAPSIADPGHFPSLGAK